MSYCSIMLHGPVVRNALPFPNEDMSNSYWSSEHPDTGCSSYTPRAMLHCRTHGATLFWWPLRATSRMVFSDCTERHGRRLERSNGPSACSAYLPHIFFHLPPVTKEPREFPSFGSNSLKTQALQRSEPDVGKRHCESCSGRGTSSNIFSISSWNTSRVSLYLFLSKKVMVILKSLGPDSSRHEIDDSKVVHKLQSTILCWSWMFTSAEFLLGHAV